MNCPLLLRTMTSELTRSTFVRKVGVGGGAATGGCWACTSTSKAKSPARIKAVLRIFMADFSIHAARDTYVTPGRVRLRLRRRLRRPLLGWTLARVPWLAQALLRADRGLAASGLRGATAFDASAQAQREGRGPWSRTARARPALRQS